MNYTDAMAIFSRQFAKKKQKKAIAFIDGDNGAKEAVDAFYKFLYNTETVYVYVSGETHSEPKCLRGVDDFKKICLRGFGAGKETVDKFITAHIQKSLTDGYNDITVVSSDYDFIDIFRMITQLNPEYSDMTFRIIIPRPLGRLKTLPAQLSNIEIIKL